MTESFDRSINTGFWINFTHTLSLSNLNSSFTPDDTKKKVFFFFWLITPVNVLWTNRHRWITYLKTGKTSPKSKSRKLRERSGNLGLTKRRNGKNPSHPVTCPTHLSFKKVRFIEISEIFKGQKETKDRTEESVERSTCSLPSTFRRLWVCWTFIP